MPVDGRMAEMCRRVFLRMGSLSALGLALPDLLNARELAGTTPAPKAKACILLYMTGGPAQQEFLALRRERLAVVGGLRTTVGGWGQIVSDHPVKHRRLAEDDVAPDESRFPREPWRRLLSRMIATVDQIADPGADAKAQSPTPKARS